MTIGERKDLENKVLDLIDNRDDFERGDLEGMVEALVMRINAMK